MKEDFALYGNIDLSFGIGVFPINKVVLFHICIWLELCIYFIYKCFLVLPVKLLVFFWHFLIWLFGLDLR